MKYFLFFLFFIVILLTGCKPEAKESIHLESPDKSLSLMLLNEDKGMSFILFRNSATIIRKSSLGIAINDITSGQGIIAAIEQKSETDETWETVNGKHPVVHNHYNEYCISVRDTIQSDLLYNMVFRLYDEGFAYRYDFPEEIIQDSIRIDQELTKLYISGDFTYWAYNGEQHTLGPIIRSDKSIETVQTPLVMKLQ